MQVDTVDSTPQHYQAYTALQLLGQTHGLHQADGQVFGTFISVSIHCCGNRSIINMETLVQ